MTKKSFKDNPALQFISTPQNDEAKDDDAYKMKPLYVEVKSRRLQLVLQPSLYDRVKKAAVSQGISVNEFIHRTLDEATKN